MESILYCVCLHRLLICFRSRLLDEICQCINEGPVHDLVIDYVMDEATLVPASTCGLPYLAGLY